MKSIEIHGEYVSNLSASNFLGAVLEFSESRGMIHRVRAQPIHEPVTSFRLAADCKRHHLFAAGNGNILCCLLVCLAVVCFYCKHNRHHGNYTSNYHRIVGHLEITRKPW